MPIEEGERCGTDRAVCLDWETLLHCDARVWVSEACEATCAELGASSTGCLSSAKGDACSCSGDVCDPGESACSTVGDVIACEGDEWTIVDCGEVCAALDPPLPTVGCNPSGMEAFCLCTHEGSSCSPDDGPACDSQTTMAVCEMDTWEVIACTGPCPADMSPVCVMWNGGPECGCS